MEVALNGKRKNWIFSVEEFREEYQKYLDTGSVKEENFDFILDTLYRFSVIGNQSRYQHQGKQHYFKYLLHK